MTSKKQQLENTSPYFRPRALSDRILVVVDSIHRSTPKYIAAYQTAPTSAVTHYAPIEKIVPYGEEGKYKLIFSEAATKLDGAIPYKDAPMGYMQGTRYTNFEKLKSAKKVTDLF